MSLPFFVALSGALKYFLLVQSGKIKPVHIVDVPGHARLRSKLDDLLPQSCGLVFVVDALDFMPHLRPAAEYYSLPIPRYFTFS